MKSTLLLRRVANVGQSEIKILQQQLTTHADGHVQKTPK